MITALAIESGGTMAVDRSNAVFLIVISAGMDSSIGQIASRMRDITIVLGNAAFRPASLQMEDSYHGKCGTSISRTPTKYRRLILSTTLLNQISTIHN